MAMIEKMIEWIDTSTVIDFRFILVLRIRRMATNVQLATMGNIRFHRSMQHKAMMFYRTQSD